LRSQVRGSKYILIAALTVFHISYSSLLRSPLALDHALDPFLAGHIKVNLLLGILLQVAQVFDLGFAPLRAETRNPVDPEIGPAW
jgi:hypothetical protein